MAQTYQPFDIPIISNESVLRNALAGGLNAPQLSSADLNNDGILDLYIFDRAGNVHLPFINKATNGTDYQFAPEYAKYFPDVENWVLLRDYNGDDVIDMFSYSATPGIDGISVYTGYFESDTLHFQPLKINRFDLADVLRFQLQSGNQTQIFVSRIDYPAIEDVDGDGDLDVLTFNVGGGFLEYFQNQSVERGYGLDSLIMTLKNPCWGGFFESGIAPDVDLSNQPGSCGNDAYTIESRHAGSTVNALNLDEDCDLELLLGDISFDNLIYVNNAGSCDLAWSTEQDIDFPSYDTPAKVAIFPNSFYLDLDGDGVRDLAVSPNVPNNAENIATIWYYKNTQNELNPQFELQQKDFLAEQILDLGSSTAPAFVDYNGDGLQDLVVGNGTIYVGLGKRDARLFLFENTGTATQPIFKLVDEDYLQLSQFNEVAWNYTPTFGDLDGDGDLDLLIGEAFGTLFFGKNESTVNNRIKINNLSPNWQGIDVGQASAPFIADINQDGLQDLLIGERNGNINYFQNIGTAQNPIFNASPTQAPNTQLFGRIDARTPGFVTGSSAPVLLEIGGNRYIATGTERGQVELYQIRTEQLDATFEAVDLELGNLKIGSQTKIAFADINANGRLEAILGNLRGGLSAFFTHLPSNTSVGTSTTNLNKKMISIHSSLNNGRFSFDTPASIYQSIKSIEVYAPLGAAIDFEWESNYITLSEDTPNGVYYVAFIMNDGSTVTKKVMLVR